MFALKRYTEDLINLLFPELCNGCGKLLYHGEKDICTKCLYDLPFTDFHLYEDNLVAKQLWGRLPVNAAMAMLYFKKGTKVQNLIHGLKYAGKTDIGITLGKLLANKLSKSDAYADIDIVIPVPLHQKKLRLRGYNQSEYIAKGLAEELEISVSTKHLLRNKSTESQTKKARYTRYENMQDVFNVKNAYDLLDKHILLVDDVITTGATLEACGNVLLNHGIKKLSIAAIAFAE
ncbi:ComF family protein [Pedobacter xixiisoli]|uniref:ComF family protein n=1 Tax=Pedobacter xixiisoli TaxID=1476464 RepID=A0A286AEM7_9SPHI|nr:ComF family protein [Pedobacter xixiisoli]SOD20354.1 comF family protein [Pedobacter xixiisoli]